MSSRLIPLTVAIAFVLIALAWMAFHRRELVIYPASSFPFSAYTDSADGGTSTAGLDQKDSILRFYYRLASGFPYPYAGMGFALSPDQPRSGNFLDLSRFDSLRITLRTTLSDELRVQIVTHDPEFSRLESPKTLRYLVQSIPVERRWQTLSLAISNFTIPEWWFSLNHLKADPSNKFLNRALHLDIQSGSRMLLGLADTVDIAQVVLVRENRSLTVGLLALSGILLIGFAGLYRLEREKARTLRELQAIRRRHEAINQAEKIPLQSHRTRDTQRILEYLGKHYTDPDLDLERVCRETAIHRNRLSQLLREEVGATFKGYLTDLRLSAATQALAETDLQVTEIAFRVGFGNVSHFNRVFKERFGISPVEYRRQKHSAKSGSDN